MAKSKFPKKIIGIGTGVVVAGVLVWLFVLPIILVSPNIAPEQPAGGFEIPIPEPIPPNSPPINPDATECEEGSTSPECTDEIIPPEEIPIDENPPPITSEDPPLEQVCDEDPDNVLCEVIVEPTIDENTVTISGLITKTDSDSVSTVVETAFDIPLQSLFIDPESNRDFRTGSLDIRVVGDTSATDLSLTGSADFDILIANQTIFTEPIQISFNKAQGSGDITTGFNIDGETKNGFLLSFQDYIDKFPEQGTTELQINLNNVEITIDSRESFTSPELNLLTMTIDSDPNLILITNEQGDVERVLPIDGGLAYHNLGLFSLDNSGSGQCRGYNTRHSGTIEIFDSENVLLQSGILKVGNTYSSECGRFWNALNLVLERDTEYRLVHSGDTDTTANFDITFKTPLSQKDYSLRCYYGNSAPLAWHTCTYPSADGTEILHAPPPLS